MSSGWEPLGPQFPWERSDWGGPTPDLDEYLAVEAKDSNVFWRIACGHHQNLLDAAVEQRDEARAEVERLTMAVASEQLRAQAAEESAERLRAAVQAVRGICERPDVWNPSLYDRGRMDAYDEVLAVLDAALGGERDE